MARFYGGVSGNRGQATRLGSVDSGLSVFGQGWDLGVRVYLGVDKDGQDYAVITLNSGTHGCIAACCLGTFVRTADGYKRFAYGADETGEVLPRSKAAG